MRRLLIGALFAAAGVFITPAAAWAHAELLSSDPGYGDRLPSAPAQVRLEFSGAMDLTGAGDHPAFVKALWKLSAYITEGSHVAGSGPSAHGQTAPGAATRPSAAKALYPNNP